ncbi:MAG TPA: FGGY family carbohydrate kinase [Candidatus Cryosericum sp.]
MSVNEACRWKERDGMAEMKECIIGIDAGTAFVKGRLVDATGTIVATASAPIQLSTPRPGWADQSPEA